MGVRIEREQLFNFRSVYEALKIKASKNSFVISGNIENWDEIEVICRIYYKQLEELLYTKELRNKIYEISLKKSLEKNKTFNKTFFEIIKDHDFNIEEMKVVLMKLDDEVYYNVRKKLPYIQNLTLISNAINELLENTKKYSSGEFVLTTSLNSDDYPLHIYIENKYNSMDQMTKNRIQSLADDINQINSFEDPSKAILNMLRERAQVQFDPKEKRASRFGFSKIHLETGSKFSFKNKSDKYGSKGITLGLQLPIKLVDKKELEKKVDSILKT